MYKNSSENLFDVVYRKGIDLPLIQNTLELLKNELGDKKQGNSIIPIEDYTMFLNYFCEDSNEILIVIYLDVKDSALSYSKSYMHSKKIKMMIEQGNHVAEIKEFCRDSIELLQLDGVLGLFILDNGGCPLITKINQERTDIVKNEVQIGGFISALFSFSNFVIGQESGGKLKEIDFGNQRFYTISKNNAIFVFLVEEITPILRRYMYTIVDEFLEDFNKELENFGGDVSVFDPFNEVINDYFTI